MKRYRFVLAEDTNMYVFYFGDNMGEAIKAFILHRPRQIDMIYNIIEEPIMEYEKP